MKREQIISIATQAASDHMAEVFKGITGVQRLPEKNTYAVAFKQLVTAAEITQEEIDKRIHQYTERRVHPTTASALERKLMAESRASQISVRVFSRLVQAVFMHESPVYVNTAKNNMAEALAAYTGKPKS